MSVCVYINIAELAVANNATNRQTAGRLTKYVLYSLLSWPLMVTEVYLHVLAGM